MVFVSKQNYGAGTTARFSLSDPKSHRIGATAWAISADHHPLSGIFLTSLLSDGELLGKHASPHTWRDLGVWFGKRRELKHATLDRIYPIITLCPINIYTYIIQKPSHATWHRRGFWYQMIGTCSLSLLQGGQARILMWEVRNLELVSYWPRAFYRILPNVGNTHLIPAVPNRGLCKK